MDGENVGNGSECVQFIGNLQGMWPIGSTEIDEKICINLIGQKSLYISFIMGTSPPLHHFNIHLNQSYVYPEDGGSTFLRNFGTDILFFRIIGIFYNFLLFPKFVSHRTKYFYNILFSIKPILPTTVRSIMKKINL
jgi:hypothetical protein